MTAEHMAMILVAGAAWGFMGLVGNVLTNLVRLSLWVHRKIVERRITTAEHWPNTTEAIRRLRVNISYLLVLLAFRICPTDIKDTTNDR